MRECGQCEVCCEYYPVAGIPVGKTPYDKPEGERCPLLKVCGSGCSIFGEPQRPKICSQYQCDWTLGAGDDDDRPDKSGLLVKTADDIDPSGQPFVFVYELRENAVDDNREYLCKVAFQMPFPIIVTVYGSEVLGGDYTIIKDKNLPMTVGMRGELLGYLDPDTKFFGMYELVKAG